MLTIKNADLTDIPLIRELTYEVWPQTYAGIISQEQIDYMLELMYSEESLKEQINTGAKFIIVYENNTPVGFASYQEIAPALFKLNKLYVLPSQQGKGTGKLLVEHIITAAKKRNGEALQLQVNRRNKAKSFYEKLGFAVIKEFDFDIGNGYVMDDYVMEKKI
jgi:diamine N-acetyltransferase